MLMTVRSHVLLTSLSPSLCGFFRKNLENFGHPTSSVTINCGQEFASQGSHMSFFTQRGHTLNISCQPLPSGSGGLTQFVKLEGAALDGDSGFVLCTMALLLSLLRHSPGFAGWVVQERVRSLLLGIDPHHSTLHLISPSQLDSAFVNLFS